jgi:transposase
MIQQQLEIPLSPYTGLYDIVVPQDDIYRQLDRLVDFSFVYEEIGKNYSWKKGRFAEDPVRMFKYLLVKIIDRLSDRRVVANALVNLSLKRFLGLSPEETNIIDASTLSKFRKLRFENVDVLNILIAKTLKIAKDKGILKGSTILVDAILV